MSYRILMVDDEAPTRELYSLYFQTQGMQVTTAATPDEALGMIRADDFDIVLLDVAMGKFNGLDLIEPARKLKPALPILVYTGRAFDKSTQEKALAFGACAVLPKAGPLSVLVQAIQQNVRRAA